MGTCHVAFLEHASKVHIQERNDDSHTTTLEGDVGSCTAVFGKLLPAAMTKPVRGIEEIRGIRDELVERKPEHQHTSYERTILTYQMAEY